MFIVNVNGVSATIYSIQHTMINVLNIILLFNGFRETEHFTSAFSWKPIVTRVLFSKQWNLM